MKKKIIVAMMMIIMVVSMAACNGGQDTVAETPEVTAEPTAEPTPEPTAEPTEIPKEETQVYTEPTAESTEVTESVEVTSSLTDEQMQLVEEYCLEWWGYTIEEMLNEGFTMDDLWAEYQLYTEAMESESVEVPSEEVTESVEVVTTLTDEQMVALEAHWESFYDVPISEMYAEGYTPEELWDWYQIDLIYINDEW